MGSQHLSAMPQEISKGYDFSGFPHLIGDHYSTICCIPGCLGC